MAPAFALDFCMAPAVTLDTQLTIYYFVVLDIMIHILNEAMSWFHLTKSDCYVRRALLSLVHVLHLVLYSSGARGCNNLQNCRVYQLLGEAGTYYGVRFGKNIPWATEFPFGVIRDPQYVGSILSLLACLSWVPFLYIFLWVLGYAFIIQVESMEDPATRAKPLS
ncbi:hypothetical protein KY289_027957 [Solanum tuberosum]|nr:hypothetical protein KY289_027957 [Solanum tuberosum]